MTRSTSRPPTSDEVTSLLTTALRRESRRRRRHAWLSVLREITEAAAYDLSGALGLMIALDVLADAAPGWRVPPLGYWTCLWVTIALGVFAAALRAPRSSHREG